jgi:hypothetical protein
VWKCYFSNLGIVVYHWSGERVVLRDYHRDRGEEAKDRSIITAGGVS